MYEQTPKLMSLIRDYRERKGVVRLVLREQIRQLIRITPLGDAFALINRIHDDEDLNVLLGVGMPGALYYAVVKRKAELMGL